MNVFAATPYRPTGLATADQGLSSVVQLLEWSGALIADALGDGGDPGRAAPPDRDLLTAAATVLRDISDLLTGRDVTPDLARLEDLRAASAACQRKLTGDQSLVSEDATAAVHAQTIAVTVRAAAADALIAARRADPDTVAAERRRWYAGAPAGSAVRRRFPGLASAIGFASPHASIRSAWFRSSARGAVALAVAVAAADFSGVQHGFWVVLGTLSVLRTSAAATGSTALRALVGTAAGFVIGAALLLVIGTSPTVLWVVLPIAVLLASYAPGTAPFAVGQAAFTVTVLVLFNLLVPAGWRVGLLRIEDVAIGTAVSIVIGALFWPRGAGAVVGDDLADAFRSGAAYLTQAVHWALGSRGEPPDAAVPAVGAGIRLDEALRGYLAEQGSKRVSKEDLWRLVMATTRLRLTAYSLASLSGTEIPAYHAGDGHRDTGDLRVILKGLTAELAGFYDSVAATVGPPAGQPPAIIVPAIDGPEWRHCFTAADAAAWGGPRTVWVRDHLQHLGSHAASIAAPATRLAEQRRTPWWR
jgi:Fusaric acid resistance protein-like